MERNAFVFRQRHFDRKKHSDYVYADRRNHGGMARLRDDRFYRILRLDVCRTAGNGADDVCAVLRCVVSDGYRLRKRGDDRRYLHDLGQQYAHSGDIHRRRNPFRHLFRRPLFTDVIGRESYLRTDQN